MPTDTTTANVVITGGSNSDEFGYSMTAGHSTLTEKPIWQSELFMEVHPLKAAPISSMGAALLRHHHCLSC